MPKIRERNQAEQIKSSKRPEKSTAPQVRRFMTAKLKKALLQQKRASYPNRQTAQDASASNEAAEQAEQAAGIVAWESAAQIERGVFRAAIKTKDAALRPKQRQAVSERPAGAAKEFSGPPRPKAEPMQNPAVFQRRQFHQEIQVAGRKTAADAEARSLDIHKKPQESAERAEQVPSTQTRQKRQASYGQQKTSRQFGQKNRDDPAGEPFGFHERTSAAGTRPASSENPASKNPSIYPSIKERPRRSFFQKEAPKSGAFFPKTRTDFIQGKPASALKPATAMPVSSARLRLQKVVQKNTARKKAETAAVSLSKKAGMAAAKALRELSGGLSSLAGGGALVCALCVVFLAAAIVASPFGILFSNEPSPGAVPLSAAISQINQSFSDKLVQLQAGDYDDIQIHGGPPDWREVAAVFACRAAGTDGVDAAALTPDRVARLEAVFWDMCGISSETETVDHPADGDGGGWRETILHITITPKTADEMRRVYTFDGNQNSALTQLLQPGMLDGLLGGLSVSNGDAAALLQRLPAGLSPERRAVVENACRLVGKVPYFWGGKSLVLGWDSRWGTPQKVTAPGSETTGTYRLFGLDCSGFVDWAFYNASGGANIPGHGGGAAAQRRYCEAILWEQTQPGDLIFYPDNSHVGIVGGWDEQGNIQIIHCFGGPNGVVITGKEGFAAAGRPEYVE